MGLCIWQCVRLFQAFSFVLLCSRRIGFRLEDYLFRLGRLLALLVIEILRCEETEHVFEWRVVDGPIFFTNRIIAGRKAAVLWIDR